MVAHNKILALICIWLSGCASQEFVITDDLPPVPYIEDLSVGPWENRYPNDKQLVGIWIQQFPDNSYDAPAYEGKHPCMLCYIFSDGRKHGFHYTPDGDIESEWWSEAPDWMLEQLDIVYKPLLLKSLIQRVKPKQL